MDLHCESLLNQLLHVPFSRIMSSEHNGPQFFFKLKSSSPTFEQSIGSIQYPLNIAFSSVSPFTKKMICDSWGGGAGVGIPTHALTRASRWSADESCEGKHSEIRRSLCCSFVWGSARYNSVSHECLLYLEYSVFSLFWCIAMLCSVCHIFNGGEDLGKKW